MSTVLELLSPILQYVSARVRKQREVKAQLYDDLCQLKYQLIQLRFAVAATRSTTSSQVKDDGNNWRTICAEAEAVKEKLSRTLTENDRYLSNTYTHSIDNCIRLANCAIGLMAEAAQKCQCLSKDIMDVTKEYFEAIKQAKPMW